EDPLTRARAAHGLGLALWRRDALEDARQALQEGLAELGDLTARSEAVMLRVDLATLLGIILGRMPESLEHARKGLARARGLRDPRWQAPATRTVGFLMVLDNRLQEGLPMLEEALRLAEAADDPAEAAEVCSALAQTYAWLGQVDRSREISLRREAFALRCHQPYPLRYVYSWLAFLDAVQGSWIAASSKLELASAAVARMASHRPAAFLEQVRGFLAYQRGDFALAEQSMRIALETFRSRDPLEYVLCLGTLALALRSRGKNPEADACRDDLMSLLKDVSSGSLVIGSARSCLGLLAIAEQDAHRAADLYPLLLPFRGQHHWFLVDRVLGGLAMLLGDLTAAAAHLSEAEALAAREHIRPEHTRLLIMQAEVTQRDRSPQAKERAGHLRTTSQAMLRDLSLSYDVQAAMLGIRGGAGGRLHYPAGLSEREVDVLKLLAGGLSNRDIAQSLALSEHTVAKHLTSIFNKTGVDNRAGAVAFAVRNGLA
ncbi:MAG TPA: LuxR C-terminal-related transcriptional regulator, partial [Longimicrobiales bacterium]|nr:LuxR C-terminal-related transcriptional regulator [Longimicrobiales bacterium]